MFCGSPTPLISFCSVLIFLKVNSVCNHIVFRENKISNSYIEKNNESASDKMNLDQKILNLKIGINGSHWVLNGGAITTFALQQGGPGFECWLGVFLHGVCIFSLCMHGFSLSTPASFHSTKPFLLG
ncbi:hypothetical protein XENOCAPTIV_020722 [Xenoophorus captivus]|uniref:Uncharacterized protein n=1 Tax=Xenoophorus captivus TaxID=1517983 RepID=A0ABV0R2D7_9TELE